MSQRGFALITVLWLVAVLATIVGLSLGATRLGIQTTANRIALARGHWAAEGCFAIAQARWAQGRLSDTATIDLGRGTHCSWRCEDPTARVNVNAADPEILRAIDTSKQFIQTVLDSRRSTPLEDIGQLASLPGVDSATAALLTVDGPGSVNLSAAAPRVLAALPGLSGEAVERILYRRSVGKPYSNLDALAAELSPSARGEVMAHYPDLARLVTFSAPVLLFTAIGWVESQRTESTIEFIVVPLPDRLAIVRRREW